MLPRSEISKKSGRVFFQGCKVRYALSALHCLRFSVRTMCRLPQGYSSEFYARLTSPLNGRANEDKVTDRSAPESVGRESGKVYGYRKLHDDLLDQSEMCCPS